MVVAGVMSGTSADGVDVALVRVSPGGDGVAKVKVLGHREFAYPREVREQVLRVAGGAACSAEEMSRLNCRLGEVYAECVENACVELGVRWVGSAQPHDRRGGAAPIMGHPGGSRGARLGLVGMHGQTVFHAGGTATWQMGEAAVVRERLGVAVVSDFRAADVAAGGQGAPLVPMLDFCMFRSKTRNRVLLNLGGIANLTAIPAGGGLEDVLAFDTGPANMVSDALMRKLTGRNFDCGGGTAGRGKVLTTVVEELMKEAYFAMAPPKSCGREQFGAAFADRAHALCVAAGAKKADVLATAVELTVRSVYEAYARWGWTHLGVRAPLARGTDLVVAGGGTRNGYLMKRLGEMFAGLGVKVMTTDELGLASQAKEAAAFALLAWLTWNGLAGNVPSATGAGRAVVLGKVTG